jgi:N-acetylmuramate 1-kinase
VNTPRKAVILAAGYATRMAPLSHETPKGLMPLWGTPLLDHTINMLESWGVRDILVNLHHGAQAVFSHLLHRKPGRARLSLSYEPEILGTGGALVKAAWFLDGSCFWIANADVAAELSPAPLLRAWQAHSPLAALWLHPGHGPRTVESRNGLITEFHSATPGAPGTATFCGLHLVSPRVLQYLPPTGFAGIVDAYKLAMSRGERVAGVTVPNSFWADMGTPRDYLDTHRNVRNAARAGRRGAKLFSSRCEGVARRQARCGTRVRGFAAIAPTAVLSPETQIENSVLLAGAVIHRGARLKDAIVGPSAHVYGQAEGAVIRPDALPGPEVSQAIRDLGWPPDRVMLIPLDPRGSARTFYRARYGHRSAIVIRFSLERPENGLYAGHAQFLSTLGVRVPAVLLDQPDRCITVFEDLGGDSLLDRTPSLSSDDLLSTYRQVLDACLPLHVDGHRKAVAGKLRLCPPFDATLYDWEHGLFAEHLLRKRLHCAPREVRAVLRECRGLTRALLKEPLALIHRDLQSTNVLFTRGAPAFIDFQGMRFGAVAYDVASLLCDPYVFLPAPVRDELAAWYAQRLGRSPARFAESFRYGAAQRLLQALGAFGRLSAMRETRRFEAHIQPGIRMLLEIIEPLDLLPNLARILTR